MKIMEDELKKMDMAIFEYLRDHLSIKVYEHKTELYLTNPTTKEKERICFGVMGY